MAKKVKGEEYDPHKQTPTDFPVAYKIVGKQKKGFKHTIQKEK